MVFSSSVFLFVFLPVSFISYMILAGLTKHNTHVCNALLILLSLVFYAYGEPVFVLVMIAMVFANYGIMMAMLKVNGIYRKLILAGGIVLDVGLLVVCKYTGFVTGGALSFPLPVGISFFTFQMLSYDIDVYREPELAQTNPFKVLLYISLFPQLIAGPIVRYHDIKPFLSERHLSTTQVAVGVSRFILGLSKKVLIANPIGEVVDAFYDTTGGGLPLWAAWIAALGYALQIYYDFSGYSDMAIGLGKMFGFDFKENFEKPYMSGSMRNFWRRWHISLSSWFRSYVYIPLGGNRKGAVRAECNKLLVFFLTGLWHGAGWGFIVWGMIHGIAVVIEDLLRRATGYKKKAERSFLSVIGGFFGWIITFGIVIFAFVWFRSETLTQGWLVTKNMFGVATGTMDASIWNQFFNPFYIVVAVFALVGILPAIRMKKWCNSGGFSCYLFALIAYALCAAAIAGGAYNPFIYFRF